MSTPVDLTDSGILLAYFSWMIGQGWATKRRLARGYSNRITIFHHSVADARTRFLRKALYGKHELLQVAAGFGIRMSRTPLGMHFDHPQLHDLTVKLPYIRDLSVREEYAVAALMSLWEQANVA